MCKKNSVLGIVILLLYPIFFQAQIFVNDSFSDGNLSANPPWLGETQKFEVNLSNQLQLNDLSAISPAYLLTSSNIINQATWEFWLRMEFAPSASNYGIVYLVSDNPNLTQNLNGYFVQIGGVSGTVDDVSLYRQDGSNSTKLIDGVDGTVGLDPVDVKIKVTKDSAGEWELFIDTSAAKNNYVSQGKATDLSHVQSSYFGVLCTYTSTRSDKFFFDDIALQGVIFQDTVQPRIRSVAVIDSTTLSLTFSEKVEATTAKDPLNYELIASAENPNSVDYLGNDSSILQLNFTNSFGNGVEYTLEVRNVEDFANNVMVSDSFPFLYFKSVPALYREVVINEFYPDFTPSQGLPEAEFVELYNASNKIFDLANWSLSDGTSTATLNNYFLRPGDYLILCDQNDTSSFHAYGDVLGLSSFPTLNNTGDLIQLRDFNQQLIDGLSYDLSWYQDENKRSGGWSIEQINPFANCFGVSNFSASTSNAGGTPGTQNSIFDTLPDTTPPKLVQAEVLSVDSILLVFNEQVDTSSVLTATYSFTTNVTINGVFNLPPDYKTVLVTLSDGLDSGRVNTLRVNGIRDCPGNLMTTNNEVELVVPGIAAFRDVVINEVFADFSPTVGLPEAEFIELYNASNKIFDLNNWQLTDGTTVSNLQSFIFKPGDYVILCPLSNAAAFENFGPTQGQSAFPALGNSEDEIFLKTPNAVVIDHVDYDESWYQDEIKRSGGWTLEQINPNLPCSGGYNFKASENSSGGTPGNQNSVFDNRPDQNEPKLKTVWVNAADTIQLVFSEGISQASLENTTLSFSNGSQVDTLLYEALRNEEVIAVINPSLDSGEVVSFSIGGLEDCSGNVIDSNARNQLALPQEANFNDLVINEILFNPRSGGYDFIELFNRSEKIISIQHWKVGNAQNQQEEQITTLPYLLFPKEYLALTENIENIIQEYPQARADRIIEVDDLPSFNNDAGTPYMLDQSAQTIDQINYSEEMHFELLREVKGVSLERINPYGESKDARNFHSAAETVNFATPGYQNSQYSLQANFNGTVNINPETFSPDQDGYQDLLNINYQFEEGGYLANIRIYDRNGRLIKNLVNNELLGLSGTFRWDGITEENTKARIGIYIVYFEVFNSNGDQQVFKESAVLAGFMD